MFVNEYKLVSDVRRIAAQNPTYVYPKVDSDEGLICVYFDKDGFPSCIIGQGLAQQGWTLESLKGFDSLLNTLTVGALFQSLELPVSDSATRWLSSVQCAQDAQSTWGRAVTWADNRYEWSD